MISEQLEIIIQKAFELAKNKKHEFLTLEQYLQEYFGQILRKLKEVNYQQTQRSNDISFL